MNQLSLLFAVLLSLSACGGGSSGAGAAANAGQPVAAQPASQPPSVERPIRPAALDPTLPAADAEHYAINPSPAVAPKERLVVVLPGTGGIPANLREFTRAGPPRGYHVVGIAYPNSVTVAEYCASSRDADCTGNTRREIITGADTSQVVAVNRANSIIGRLTRLLTHLSTTYPTEGWGRFLTNGEVDWALVTVTGHSQGSGHAAYMAKLYNLDRVVMFSGPADYGNGVPAAWLSQPSVTPASRQYGFTHLGDELVPYALVRSNWGLLGLNALGEPTSVDGANPPYGNSRQLTTNATPDPSNNPAVATYLRHLATAIDGVTPHNTQGVPIYTPAWQYLAFP